MDETKLVPNALKEIRKFLDAQGWEYCLIGGLAAARWGEARFTKDIDLVIKSGFGHENDFIRPLLSAFPARLAGAAEFAKVHRIVLVSSSAGIGIDISLGGLPFEDEMLSRARPTKVVSGVEIRTATPEDIVVTKCIAGRPIDVKDIEGIIAHQGKKLDATYIRRWLSDLAALWTETDVVGVFETAMQTVSNRMKQSPRPIRRRKKKGE